MRKKLFFFTMILVLLGSLTLLKGFPNTTIGTDSTNDVEKISFSTGFSYDYDKGDFKDEIDIVSVQVENIGNGNISMSVTFQDTPVYDGYHLYWVWISFEGEGDEGSAAGAWFWAGGYEGSNAASSWWVWGNSSDYMSIGTGDDEPTINAATHSMSWETNSTYWDDLSNVGNWGVQVWAWTSDGLSYAESIMSGTSYWDYYPDDESKWESTSDNSTTTTGSEDNDIGKSSPGFELLFPLISLPVIAALSRKKDD
ncbi:MAG: hypothetical protein ACTSPG_02415 [Candidatus Hodarchaeales archaeon]